MKKTLTSLSIFAMAVTASITSYANQKHHSHEYFQPSQSMIVEETNFNSPEKVNFYEVNTICVENILQLRLNFIVNSPQLKSHKVSSEKQKQIIDSSFSAKYSFEDVSLIVNFKEPENYYLIPHHGPMVKYQLNDKINISTCLKHHTDYFHLN